MAAIFHFQVLGETGWEPVCAGLGAGADPMRSALDEVRELCGGNLPAGSYRVIQSRTKDARWETFRIDKRGRVLRDRR
jgi:hypothetical protein